MLPSSIPIPLPGGLHGPLPRFFCVGQKFSTKTLENIDRQVAKEFQKFHGLNLKNKSIAIGVGSRGIKQQPVVVQALVRELLKVGAKPFIIPAMGSHGGGNAEGQVKVLANYGITEDSMGVPIRATMEVVELCKLEDGTPIYCDKLAYAADFIIACNRIKPHTSFRGPYESGLMKMLAIGLGKHAGATALHFRGFAQFHQLIPAAGKAFIKNTKTLFGVAMVENSEENLQHLEFVANTDFVTRDAALLDMARGSIPQLLFDDIDVLVVDEIGKNISGAGLDPNVTGRAGSREPGFDREHPIGRIVVRNLTEETEGNAAGIGMSDVTTQCAVGKIDWTKTYLNMVTAGALDGGKLPIVADTDKDAIGIAIRGCPGVDSKSARIVRIKNTLEMTKVWASETLLSEINNNQHLEVLSDPFDCQFDNGGYLMGSVY